MASTIRLTPYGTAITAIAGTALSALAVGTYAWGPEIDNSTNLYTNADLQLDLFSAVTSVAPAYLPIFIVITASGNYPASSGNPGSSYNQRTFSGAGGSLQFIPVAGLELPAYRFKVVIQNQLGVALPASTASVCNLYPYNFQSV